jgi:hypothetical protein
MDVPRVALSRDGCTLPEIARGLVRVPTKQQRGLDECLFRSARFTNVVTVRASEISGGARLMVGKVNVVAIVLPPL